MMSNGPRNGLGAVGQSVSGLCADKRPFSTFRGILALKAVDLASTAFATQLAKTEIGRRASLHNEDSCPVRRPNSILTSRMN